MIVGALSNWAGLMIADITWNCNLVSFFEGLYKSNPCRLKFLFFCWGGICRNRTDWDGLGIGSPAVRPTELVLHCLGFEGSEDFAWAAQLKMWMLASTLLLMLTEASSLLMVVIAVVVMMAASVSMTLWKLREPRSWKCGFDIAAEAM